MAILIGKETKVLVQAITGKSGSLQTKVMLDAGTKIVAGVTPGKGGQEVHGVPVYDYISEAKKEHDFDTVISFWCRRRQQRTPVLRPLTQGFVCWF